MIRRIGWVTVFTVLGMLALLLLASGCESPEDGSSKPGGGGKVTVTKASASSIQVWNSWGSSKPAGKSQTVRPGNSSTFNDADGLCAPKRRYAEVKLTGWPFPTKSTQTLKPGACLKIGNGSVAEVTSL